MNRRYCDRCDCELGDNYNTFNFNFKIYANVSSVDTGDVKLSMIKELNRGDFDLCNPCKNYAEYMLKCFFDKDDPHTMIRREQVRATEAGKNVPT